MPSTGADETFLKLGIQYYTAARWAALAKLMPVCGNLYHHAIEMFLKARLSQNYTLEQLSHHHFSHKLDKLWDTFKSSGVAFSHSRNTCVT